MSKTSRAGTARELPPLDYKMALGIPDWRDGFAYPDPDRTTDDQWWWECLRRRDDYRLEWRATYDAAQAQFDRIFASGNCGGDAAHREWLRCKGMYKLEYRKRFKLWESLLAPAVARPPPFFSPRTPGRYNIQYRSIEDAEQQEAGEQQLAFDLRKPLAPQLDSAKDYLTRLQREYVGDVVQARHHKRKWPLYLQVIDARDDHETWDRIFDALLAGEVSAEDAGIEASDRLIDQGASAGAAKARQVWEQAHELMFKLTA